MDSTQSSTALSKAKRRSRSRPKLVSPVLSKDERRSRSRPKLVSPVLSKDEQISRPKLVSPVLSKDEQILRPKLSSICISGLQDTAFRLCIQEALKECRFVENFKIIPSNMIVRLMHSCKYGVDNVIRKSSRAAHDEVMLRLYHPNSPLRSFEIMIQRMVKEIREWPESLP
jgi:hypothetical protein